MTPKSGSPVFGHIDVNSGQSIAISNSRSGRGFGKVSIVAVDMRISLRQSYARPAGCIDSPIGRG